MVVKDQRGNNIVEGEEVVYQGGLSTATIQKITSVMDNTPMNGGIIVEAVHVIRWVIPPSAPPVLPAFKVSKPDSAPLVGSA